MCYAVSRHRASGTALVPCRLASFEQSPVWEDELGKNPWLSKEVRVKRHTEGTCKIDILLVVYKKFENLEALGHFSFKNVSATC